MSFHKINAQKKTVSPALIMMSLIATLLIALLLVDYGVSSLSASAQQINGSASNETVNAKVGDNQVNTQVKVGGNMSSDYAGRLSDQGHALLKLKKFNEAIALFDKALAINPNNSSALNGKGVALGQLKNFESSHCFI